MLKLFDNMDIDWRLVALKLGSVDHRAYMDGGFLGEKIGGCSHDYQFHSPLTFMAISTYCSYSMLQVRSRLG